MFKKRLVPVSVADAHAGLKVQLDDWFTCASGVRTLLSDEHGLYFYCSHGKHRIDGHVETIRHRHLPTEFNCVGLYHVRV